MWAHRDRAGGSPGGEVAELDSLGLFASPSSRRYRRRRLIERTNTRLQNFRRLVTRSQYRSYTYGGFVQFAYNFIALGRL
jgi:hypothetical protein